MEFDIIHRLVQLIGRVDATGTYYSVNALTGTLEYRNGTLSGEVQEDTWQYSDLRDCLEKHTTKARWYSEALKGIAELCDNTTDPITVRSIEDVGISINFRDPKHEGYIDTLAIADEFVYSSVEDKHLHEVIADAVDIATNLGYPLLWEKDAKSVVDYVKRHAGGTYECLEHQGCFKAVWDTEHCYVYIETLSNQSSILFDDGQFGGKLWLQVFTLCELARKEKESPELFKGVDENLLSEVLAKYYTKVGIDCSKEAIEEMCRILGLCQGVDISIVTEQVKELGGFSS